MKKKLKHSDCLDLSKDFSVADYYIDNKSFLRIFNNEIESKHFEWHRDEKNREVKVVYADKGWELQFDNYLPFSITTDMSINIKKNAYHRLLKGAGSLILLVKES